MKEVHDLASGMRELVAGLRKSSTDAKDGLLSEIQRGQVNASKVKAMAQDLKAANLEVEGFLGETPSNFSGSETLNTPAPKPKTDINGVTLNTET